MSEEMEGLTTDDLLNVLRVINTATERSAFKAHELSFVGTVYDKFSGIIKHAERIAAESSESGNQEVDENDSK
jgi:hypothetical protein